MAHKKIAALLGRIVKETIALKLSMPRRWSATAAGMCAVLLASAAVADQWAWTFNSVQYPTKAAALAAMQASGPPYTTVLTQETGIGGIGSASVSYQYGAPLVPPSSFTAWSYCPMDNGGVKPCNYASEADSVSAWIAGWNNPCYLSVTPTSGWQLGYVNNVPSTEARNYQTVWGILSNGKCLQNTQMDLMGAMRSYSCPAGYVAPVNANGLCYSYNTGLISHQLLDCPQTGGSAIIGDPCDASTGDYFQNDTDYTGPTLRFSRSYHSQTLPSHNALGIGWSHNFSAHLVINPGNGRPIGLERPDGRQEEIQFINFVAYIGVSGAGIHVDQNQSTNNFTAHLADGSSELYDPSGNLLQIITRAGLVTTLARDSSGNLLAVTDPFGHTLQFSYANGLISSVTDPAGSLIKYAYDTHNNLKSVTYADGTTTTYLYENASFPNHLTGVSDESMIRYSTIAYDSMGRVTSSQRAGGADAVTITGYGATSTSTTDALGAATTFTFTNQRWFTRRAQNITRNALTQSYAVPTPSVDAQQRATQSIDANGNVTTYSYDVDHLTSKTEAFGTSAARTTSYQYLSTLSALPTLITEPLRLTSYAYFPGTNNVQTKTITDVGTGTTRSWNYTYNAYGQILTIDGPRTDVSDVTTYAYYTCTTGNQCGQINTIKNALGQITTFNTYNAHGQPLTITDPNGVITTLTYDLRQRIKSRQVGTETTSYLYYPTGQVETITLPDSSTMTYIYDGAHRLTDLTDGLGNHTHYTLDAMGNRTAENTYDPSATLRRTHTRFINALNELYQDITAANTAAVTTTYGYDNNGNLTSSDAPLLRNTVNKYDPLNRLQQITDPANGVTKLAYDTNDQLTSVIDPRSLSTTYTRNGFGDLAKQVSPDTGTTTNTFDSGGNLKTSTDARGAQVTNTYDSLNRVTQHAYSDETINITYDAGTNGKGRLTGASDANHSLSWTYDPLGHVTGKGQTVGGVSKSVGYSYTNGDLVTLVTPSGQTITYGYTNHRITSITVNGTTLLTGVTYFPFGAVSGWTWGNASTVSRTYNTDGNVSQIKTAGDVLTFGYDNALRISSLSDTLFGASGYTAGYDALDRLNSLVQTGATSNWTFDADGNHLTQTGTSTVTTTPSTTSNRVSSISGSIARTYGYDAAGNTLSYTGASFGFNQHGRMSSATVGSTGASYIYNALGQLTEKTVAGVTTILMYDEAGHVLGEYASSGALIQETVWMDDTPVATLRPNGSAVTIYYVHTDHLNAPRVVTQSSSDNSVRWLWGGNAANQNPLGLGAFVYNLRYPGQYYQAETGLNYNYFRDYDPVTGRYLESDPIGLKGGINTYAYVNDNPVGATDPTGLVMWRGTYLSGSIGYKGAGAEHWTFTLLSDCVNNQKWIIKVSATAAGPGLGLPWTISGSTVEFDDHSATPNPNAFNGVFKFAAAGFAGPIGYGWSEFIAGSATARLSGAVEAGIDLSFSSGVGQSSLTSKGGPFCCNQ